MQMWQENLSVKGSCVKDKKNKDVREIISLSLVGKKKKEKKKEIHQSIFKSKEIPRTIRIK